MKATQFVVICTLFLLDIQLFANAETYVIPLSLNPFIQTPIKLTGTPNIFYNTDPRFYSKVTLTDAALDSHQDLKEIVKKKLSVVFMTVASSYVAETLKESDLKYTSGSKWSYNTSVEELITASNGSVSKLSQDMELYMFQELGMRVLEKRYNFKMSNIQSHLRLSRMEFLGADEKQWINIVRIITEEIINNRSKLLNMSPCYLAELLNKTEHEIATFTLNEVDEHIYNVSSLQKKLPEFKESVLATTFNVTVAHLANISGLNVTTIKSLGLQDQIQLLTKSILNRFDISIDEIATKYKKSSEHILTPCSDEWKPFQTMIVQEAFENQATNISITNKTLASLIQILYANISKLSFDEMEHLIDTKIKMVKEKKTIIEHKTIHMLNNNGSHPDVINLNENAFSIIETVTNFSKSELSLIYGWKDSHYLFAETFSVADLVQLCSSEVYNYTLLKLAMINAGEDTENGMCRTISALRKIWDRATVNDIERRFGKLFSNSSIENMLVSLTGRNLTFINRVLNLSADTQALCANVALDHISMATSLPTMHLKQMPFQDIIDLAVELKANGSFFQNMKMTSTISPVTSRIVSSMQIPTNATRTIETKAMMATRNTTYSILYPYSFKTDNRNGTRIANYTITHKSANLTIQHNSLTDVIVTTRITHPITIGPVSSSNELLTKRFLLMLILLQSMALVNLI